MGFVRWSEAVVVSLDRLLDDHEVVVRARVEQLRGELERVGAQLSAAQDALGRVEITRATLREVLEASAVAGGQRSRRGDQGLEDAPVVVAVPQWRAELTCDALPVSYRSLWEAVRAAGGGVRCRQVAVAIGLEPSPAGVEGVRAKLKRLVARGWALEAGPGLFTARV